MKTDFSINGIQQVGIGTSDFSKTWAWMSKLFGMNVKILEDDTVAERMLPYTGGVPQQRHACIAINTQGGSGAEIWQYSKRQPLAPDEKMRMGDLGIGIAKIRCRDVRAFYGDACRRGHVCSDIQATPDGIPTFFVEDPFGNIFQVIEDKAVYINRGLPTGGIAGAVIGVSDMERALQFYHTVLGYDNIIYETEGVQPDWKALNGGEEHYKRVLLSWKKTPDSAFAGLFGEHTIELVQALDRTPKKLYEGRYWGDPGFIQLCYDVTGMDALGASLSGMGCPFTVDSCPTGERFDMGEASGRFTYIEDPDGTLIEFVETYKIPIAKKWGWYLDLQKRNPRKRLPKFLFRVLGMVATQTFDD